MATWMMTLTAVKARKVTTMMRMKMMRMMKTMVRTAVREQKRMKPRKTTLMLQRRRKTKK